MVCVIWQRFRVFPSGLSCQSWACHFVENHAQLTGPSTNLFIAKSQRMFGAHKQRINISPDHCKCPGVPRCAQCPTMPNLLDFSLCFCLAGNSACEDLGPDRLGPDLEAPLFLPLGNSSSQLTETHPETHIQTHIQTDPNSSNSSNS